MKSVIFTAMLFVMLSPILVCATTPPAPLNKDQVMNKAYRIQIPFIENKGQVADNNVTFYAKTFGGTVFVGKDGTLTYNFMSEDKGGVIIKEVLTDKKVEVKGMEPSPTKINYFKGKDQSRWKTNIPSYNRVSLGEVYKGVEMTLKAYGKNVEKLFTVLPGVNPELIKVALVGAQELKVTDRGELAVITKLGPIRFTKPIAYQETDGKRVEVEVAYQLQESGVRSQKSEEKNQETKDEKKETGIRSQKSKTRSQETEERSQKSELGNPHSAFRNLQSEDLQPATRNPKRFSSTLNAEPSSLSYGFKVAPYDKTKPLIIDPLLASTFIGGSEADYARSITLDASGNVYVTGYTPSTDYPTTSGVYDETYNSGNYDVFVSKLDSDLANLLASTFLGGGDHDQGNSLALDGSGIVYITGYTSSTDYPTTSGVYDQTYNNGGYDVFVSKLDSDLSSLEASTFIGGDNIEMGSSIVLDGSGNVYIGGTAFINYPTTTGAYDESWNGLYDLFVSKLDSSLTSLLASTFIGGSGWDYCKSINLDGSGSVYVAGDTVSSDYPTTTGAYDESFNGLNDVSVSKLDSDLANLLASTFIGGDDSDDYISSIALDGSGDVYMAGYATSSSFPTTTGAYDESFNGDLDVFVSKLDGGLGSLLVSTFIGGYSGEGGNLIAIALDGCGNAYITGHTSSSDFPTTTGAYDESFNGVNDVFVSKLDSTLSFLFHSTYIGGEYHDSSHSVALDRSGNVCVTGSAQDDFPTILGAYDHIYNGGTYDVFVSKLDSFLSLDESGLQSAKSSFLFDPFAVSLKFDVDQDGIFDLPCTELLLCEGQIVDIDIWLDNWDSVNWGDVESVSYDLNASDFTWNEQVLQVESITCDPQWDGSCTVSHTPGTTTYHLEVAKDTGGFPGPEVKLHTIRLKCIDIVEPVFVTFAIDNISVTSSDPPASLEDNPLNVNAICGADSFTCDADDHCERLSYDNICPDTGVAEKDNYYYRDPQGSVCEGGTVNIYHVRKGDYPVTEAATETMCDSDCFKECYDNCGYNEVHVCYLQCVKGCVCDHCEDWDEVEVCYEYQKRVDCNVECYSQCIQSYDPGTETAQYNKRCGYDLNETVTIRNYVNGDCTTGAEVETFTISGLGVASIGRPMPLTPGTYEICAGTQLIGQPVEVTDCGDSCRIILPKNKFKVNKGVNDTINDLTIESDVNETYTLSLEVRDYYQGSSEVPEALGLSVPEPIEVAGGESLPFPITATNPQPDGRDYYWPSIVIKAVGSLLTCEAAFEYEISADEDEDGVLSVDDNCPNTPNEDQLDTYPTQGNNIGDACDCEADFNCDGNVDGGDVGDFLEHFGRSTYFNPCSNQDQCLGDFNCDVNVDGGDVGKFIEDFGRSQYFNPCPVCVAGDWCIYE